MSLRESALRLHASRHSAPLLGLLTTVVLLLGTSQAHAQSPVQLVGDGRGVTTSGPTEAIRLNAYGVLRGGGSWRVRGDGGSASDDAGVGGGLGLRVEIPLHEYFVLGPMVDFHVLTLDPLLIGDRFRINTLTFGVWSKGRYLFDLSGHPFEVYVSVPMGLSLYFADQPGWDTQVGVSVGLLLGAQLFINERFGFLLENGFRRDGFREDGLKYRTLQFVMNAGISIAF
ncbi:MAG: hypothetical protein R3B40_05480 [Polyangiales bacterium]|nr:hypothetical protein [Myxococcales bacterium]MCB9660768.1 hypothetical protein [Sandaracinaceae bacterium]